MARWCSRWPFRGRRRPLPEEEEEEEAGGAEVAGEEEVEAGARSEGAGAGEGARGWALEAAAGGEEGEEVEESTSTSAAAAAAAVVAATAVETAAAALRRLRQQRPPRSSLASWLLVRLLPNRTQTSGRCCLEGRSRRERDSERELCKKNKNKITRRFQREGSPPPTTIEGASNPISFSFFFSL